MKLQFAREIVREIIDRVVIEQDSGRQSTLDDLFQRSRNLNGCTRVKAIGIEGIGRINL